MGQFAEVDNATWLGRRSLDEAPKSIGRQRVQLASDGSGGSVNGEGE
jgi:hypothetical protein